MTQGPWTDVYALAALAYAAVRGRTPPPSVGRLVNDSFEPLSQVAKGRYSERVLQAIDRGLAVRPEQRTQTIAAFKAELGLAPSPLAHAADAGFAASQPVPLAEASTVATADLPTVVVPREDSLERTHVVPREPPAPAPVPSPVRSPASAEPAAPASTPPRPVAAADRDTTPPAVSAGRGLAVAAALVAAAGAAGVWWWSAKKTPEPVSDVMAGTVPSPATTAPAPALEPAPPTAVAPPVAAAGFDPRLMFQRVVAASASGWSLQLNAPQTRWRIDRDKLSFTLQSAQDGHVYVFNHGSDGSLQQLYPNTLTPAPMAVKGQPLTLPQGALQFDVTGPPGSGELLVLVSRWPRDTTAFAPKVEGGFASFPTGSVALALEGANAGALPLLVGRAQCPAGVACVDTFAAATLPIEVTD